MKKSPSLLVRCLVPGICVFLPVFSTASSVEWDGGDTTTPGAQGGAGTWDQTNAAANWWTGTVDAFWTGGDDAVFGGAADTVAIDAAGVAAHNLTFNTDAYVVTGPGFLALNGTAPTVTNGGDISTTISAQITGSAGLTKAGGGQLNLASGIDNFTGAATITGGILNYAANGSPGSVVLNGGDLSIDNGADLNCGNYTFSTTQSITGGGSISSPGAYVIAVAAGRTGTISQSAIYSGSADENSPGWTLSAGAGGNLILNGNCIPQSTLSKKGLITFNGGGTLTVNGILSNRYTGTNAQSDKLRIGNTTAGNTVNVTGKLRSNTITIGEGAFGGNSIVATPTFPGTDTDPTVWGQGSNIAWVIGGASSSNSVTLNAGATMLTSRGNGTNTFIVGRDSGANGNSVTVNGAGARWTSNNNNKFGLNGRFNSLTVSNGGYVFGEKFFAGAPEGAGANANDGCDNSILVTDPGSLLVTNNGNSGQFGVGLGLRGSRNTFTVQNGASADLRWTRITFGFSIGAQADCNHNYVRITGSGSSVLINNSTPVCLGGKINSTGNGFDDSVTATGNHLDVHSGAAATISNGLYLMGAGSGFNLGDSIGISAATVGGRAGFTPGVVLQSATASVHINSGRLSAETFGALVSGAGTVHLDGPAFIQNTDLENGGNSIDSPISGTGNLTKEGGGILTLSAVNTFTGDTVVDAGTLRLSDNAGLKFVVSNTTSNRITGSGGALLLLDGDFTVDTSAVTVAEGSWILVDTSLEESFGPTFTMAGFTESADIWTRVEGAKTWTFNKATGTLALVTIGASPYDSWIAGFSSIPAADRDPGDDPDGDGRSNLAEFAFNGAPNDASNSGKFYWTLQDNSDPDSLRELTFTCAVRRSAGAFAADGNNAQVAAIDGINYVIEADTDLIGAWNSAVTHIGKSDSPPPGSGLPNLSGEDWEYRTFSAFNGLPGRGFIRARVTSAAETPFSSWIAGFPGIAAADRDPGDDPDGDGRSNLAEFAFNGAPNDASNSGKFYWALQDNSDPDLLRELTFTCAMRRSDVNFAANGNNAQASASAIDGIDYVIEADTDLLGTWNSSVSYIGKSDSPPPGSGLPNLSGEDWEYRTFSAFNNLGGRGFMRGRVSVAP